MPNITNLYINIYIEQLSIHKYMYIDHHPTAVISLWVNFKSCQALLLTLFGLVSKSEGKLGWIKPDHFNVILQNLLTMCHCTATLHSVT